MQWNYAEFYASYGLKSQLPAGELPEVVFAGKSNVGKSTLINKICSRKNLARVSGVPGKTVTVNFYKIPGRMFIVDLPGYGYARVAKSEKDRWAGLIEGYLNNGRDAINLVVQLIDMRHPPSRDDFQMVNFLIDNQMPFIIVLTKADKLNKTQRTERMEAFRHEIPCFEEICVIPFSSTTGEGLEELRSVLLEVTEPDDSEDNEDISENQI
jgi:GTP-binding protein